MNRHLLTALLVVAAAALALTAAGCGSSGAKLPRGTADALIARLNDVKHQSTPKPNCRRLESDTVPALLHEAANLPSNVSSDIRATVNEGIDNLRTLVETQCAAQQNQPPKQPTTTTTTPPPTTTQTQTQPPTTNTTPNTNTSPHTNTNPSTNTNTGGHTNTNPSGGVGPGGVHP